MRSVIKRTVRVVLVWLAFAWPLGTTAAAQSSDQPEPAPSPSSVFRAFGSVQWTANDVPDTPERFTLGQLALFTTSTLSERVSVLAEVVLEASTETDVVVDLERLQLTYRLNDHARLSGGRYHTGIGFYNAAFHHGAYFEIPIGRPRAFRFEDEGGVLPVHDVGVTVRGTVPKTGEQLYYLTEVGNGRRWETVDAEAVNGDDGPSTNVGLSFRPAGIPDLEIGGSFYRDRIPYIPLAPLDHRIGALFVAYRTPRVEVMAEWLRLAHRAETTNGWITSDAGYFQASKAFGKLRPYYRYDRLDIDPGAPLIGTIGSQTGHSVGLRVDPGAWVGLKAQYERSDWATRRGVDAVRAELVFVF
jgi:hypothetical protein